MYSIGVTDELLDRINSIAGAALTKQAALAVNRHRLATMRTSGRMADHNIREAVLAALPILAAILIADTNPALQENVSRQDEWLIRQMQRLLAEYAKRTG